jgi:thiol-activated cytolysin
METIILEIKPFSNKLISKKTEIMKKIFLTSFVIFAMSCSKTDSPNTDLNSLLPINYQVRPDTEKSAVLTGATATDPNTGLLKKEYLVKTEKSAVFSNAALTKDNNIETSILYPGSILRGSSYLNGDYDPLVLANAFKPVTLFLTIKGSQQVTKENVSPKGSAMFQAISDLKLGNTGYFPVSYIPGNYSFESTEITNEDSFKKSIGLHIKANYAALVAASFDYNYNTATANNKKYVMLKLKQTVYSAGIDPVNQANWIDGGIQTQECGTHEPIYISSIDYGRVAYLLVETNKTTEQVSTMIKASLDLKIGLFTASSNYTYNSEFQSLFNSQKIKVSVLGGPSAIVTNYDQFIDYMNLANNPNSLLITSVPINYTVRRMKDNTVVNFVNYYNDFKKEFR